MSRTSSLCKIVKSPVHAAQTTAISHSPTSVKQPLALAAVDQLEKSAAASTSVGKSSLGSQRVLQLVAPVLQKPSPSTSISVYAVSNKSSGSGSSSSTAVDEAPSQPALIPQNLQFQAVLGTGTFGNVFLVEDAHTKALYALKCVDKKFIIEKGHVENLLVETQVYQSVHSPFVARCSAMFQTETQMHFVLEYLPGGDLFGLFGTKDRFEESEVRFYIAEILLGIEALHEKNFVHRDLKPDNVMIDANGHSRLIDFGLGKHVEPKVVMKTALGTPDYMAPEVIAGKEYDRKADLWSLGIVMFELLTGDPPFVADNPVSTMKNAVLNTPDYPKYLSAEAVELLQQLLAKDPKNRPTLADIKKHPWFASIDWDDAAKGKLMPPFKPTLSDAKDISYAAGNFGEANVVFPTLSGTRYKPTLANDPFKNFPA